MNSRRTASYGVIGLGFGDEGKGRVTDYLCSKLAPPISVVRYSGGQQAGHHVISENGFDHVYSNFGSGSHRENIFTEWSKFCTVDPVGIHYELEVLKKKGIVPYLYIDPECPITTPYEKRYNQRESKENGHGTVGVGVGATWEREANLYSLRVKDLFYPSVLKIKIEQISKYYNSKRIFLNPVHDDLEELYSICNSLLNRSNIEIKEREYNINVQYVYEGSQGLLLDQDIGFFPNVTRSNVGSKNIINLMDLSSEELDLYYVTRAYQTRHGNGPMTNLNIPHSIKDFEHEKNVTNKYQGEFRKSILNLDLIEYAYNRDQYEIRNLDEIIFNRNLVITCLDALEEYKCTYKERVHEFKTKGEFINFIFNIIGADALYISESPISTELELIRRR